MNSKFKIRFTIIIILLLSLSPLTASSSAQDSALTLVGTTERVSVASDGTQGNSWSGGSSISVDGIYVAFVSATSNLVSGDTNGAWDIFVHDRVMDVTNRVSVARDGTQGNGDSSWPSISANGRYVAFESAASNLVDGDTNVLSDIFAHDRETGETTRISIASDGTQGNGNSYHASISEDGRYVAFYSSASNLVGGDTNGVSDIFVHDRTTGETTRMSVATNGTQGNKSSYLSPSASSISADGLYLAFYSYASNLVDGDTNGVADIFVHDRTNGETTRVSVATNGTQGNIDSDSYSLSADGRYVAFESRATNLVDGDTNGASDIFVHGRVTGVTKRVSVAREGTQGNNNSRWPNISSDGCCVAFESIATNLVDGDTNGFEDIFVHDQVTEDIQRVSVASDGMEGNYHSFYPIISAEGRIVSFSSGASNLVEGDTNGLEDVFVHERGVNPSYFLVSGRVIDPSGNALSGVSISAGPDYSAITDSQGYYVITNIIAGRYTLTPALVGYVFSPASRTIDGPPDAVRQDFTGTSIQITRFEVNQVLGQQKDGEKNYVAGKATALRVFLNVSISINPSIQQAVVKRDGNTITTLHPKLQAEPINEISFLCSSMSDCENWLPGNYSFEISVNGINAQYTSFEFVERRYLRILAVPVRVKVGNDIIMPDERWKTAQDFLIKVYPIPNNGVVWTQGTTLDATDLDLNTKNSRVELWKRLNTKQPFLCGLPFRPPCYDQIIGFIPEIHICDLHGCVGGWTYGIPSTIVMTKDVMQASVAHEVGHIRGLGDEYGRGDQFTNMCGVFFCSINPPPPTYCGREGISNCDTKFKCVNSSALPWIGKGTGSKVIGKGEEQDYPYDVTDRGALGDMLSFMGSDETMNKYWITPAAYHHLFGKMTPSEEALPSTSATEVVVQASGMIGKDGSVQLDPWISFPTTPTATISGSYTIESLDAADQVLASQGFDVSFVAMSNPPLDLDSAPFQVVLPFPTGTVLFQIKQGSSVLHRIDVSDNSPVVNVTSPNGSESWGSNGNETITWTGSDANGDLLYYTVLYTPNGTDWVTISANMTTTQTTIALDEIPGGASAKIQVIATDGINTSVDESDGPFTVGNKGPSAYILSPITNATIPFGTSFYLHGYGYDLEDGNLDESSLMWSSNKDGYLGTSSLLLVNLSPGYHTITLSAIDNTGAFATDVISVYIGSLIYLPVVTLQR